MSCSQCRNIYCALVDVLCGNANFIRRTPQWIDCLSRRSAFRTFCSVSHNWVRQGFDNDALNPELHPLYKHVWSSHDPTLKSLLTRSVEFACMLPGHQTRRLMRESVNSENTSHVYLSTSFLFCQSYFFMLLERKRKTTAIFLSHTADIMLVTPAQIALLEKVVFLWAVVLQLLSRHIHQAFVAVRSLYNVLNSQTAQSENQIWNAFATSVDLWFASYSVFPFLKFLYSCILYITVCITVCLPTQ